MMRKKYHWNPYQPSPNLSEQPEVQACDYFAPVIMAVGINPAPKGPLDLFESDEETTERTYRACIYVLEDWGHPDLKPFLLGQADGFATIDGAKSVAKKLARFVAPLLRLIRVDRNAGRELERMSKLFGYKSGWWLAPHRDEDEEIVEKEECAQV